MIEYGMVRTYRKFELICIQCGSLFKNKHKDQKYCSHSCMGKAQITIKKTNCFVCGKSFRPKTLIKANKYCSQKCYWDWMVGNTKGNKCNAWDGGKRTKDYLLRREFQQKVQKKVFKRDNYTCKMCKKRGVVLHVDHIKKWSDYPELRFDIDNCRTLCMKCHYKVTFHREMPKDIKAWGHNP